MTAALAPNAEMEVFPQEKNLNLKGPKPLTNLINPNNPNPAPVGEVCQF